MIVLDVHRAQDIGTRATQSLSIEAAKALPEDCDGPALMEADAKAIVDAMVECLPYGTLERITGHLLLRRATELRVSTAELNDRRAS